MYNYVMQDIIIGSDHNGFNLKTQIKQFLLDKKLFVIDVGVPSAARPDNDLKTPPILSVVKEVTESVKTSKHFAGILICASGAGVVIAANRFKGIRAAVCPSPDAAKNMREHNDINVLCISANYGGDFEETKKIITTFLNTRFMSEVTRYRIRCDLFDKMEEVK